MKQEETLILRQNDKGNQIEFIFSDLTDITSAELRVIKPDDTFVIAAGAIDTERNIVTFTVDEQMCTVPGKGRFNIRLISTDLNVYTYVARCIIDINLDLENAVESTAQVNGLTFPDDFLTIEDIPDLSNYATKEYVNNAISEIPTYTPISYSTEEQDTGLTWVDGNHIYQKSFTRTNQSYGGGMSFDTGVANMDTLINDRWCIYGALNVSKPVTAEGEYIRCQHNGNGILTIGSSNYNYNGAPNRTWTLTIWYTKTTNTN